LFREPSAKYAEMGNITAQLALKKNLQCKSFDWFIKNVAYDMLEKVRIVLMSLNNDCRQYPKLPPNVQLGSLVNVGSRSCLDTLGRSPPRPHAKSGREIAHRKRESYQ
jgi:polypeptide N-acetylgalactosaminyltransferase